ncbi:helix-turn-helix domain-containing protein [Actinocorallia sp. API 0066]|uniref:helix-turn-helix domain-containing protein n=1 Tax=Actinocorallia sp. API 0066 TaxID=2896846 RepID=UPI001E3010DB|nr:helix-turn-helix domain-containing protein [Actinocorallia sp. API 0066]MCD0449509.1 helix-turn-helix domain-containing protein [Actinocorallia sp. API 0066]
MLPTRPDDTDVPPITTLAHELAEPLRPHLEAAAAEMVREIQALVPEYARPPDSPYGRRMSWAIGETVRCFVDAIGRPEADWAHVIRIYEGIGVHEARKGRGLGGLQAAIRMSGQVACRRFIRDAKRLGWSLDTVGVITEALFVFLERISAAAERGFAGASEQLRTERERLRSRLRELLLADPVTSHEALSGIAHQAGWPLPRSVAVVAFPPRPVRVPAPVVPPEILADWYGPRPYVIVPDPDGRASTRQIAALVGEGRAAVGPSVEPGRAAESLRWARRTLALVEAGAIDAVGPVRCLDHVPTLVAAESAELLEVALPLRLAPLAALPANRREPLMRTLLSYLECGGNAVAAAERVRAHEQTVRYRIRRASDLIGTDLNLPERRLDLMLLLHAWSRLESGTPPDDG